jgi:hypothetical protein
MLRWDNFKSNYQPMLCFCKFPTLLPIAIPKMFKIYIEKMTFQYNNHYQCLMNHRSQMITFKITMCMMLLWQVVRLTLLTLIPYPRGWSEKH